MPTVRIPLTQGKFAVIDEEDYPLIAGITWRAVQTDHSPHLWYAVGQIGHKKPILRMHRVILGVSRGAQVDHIDGNGLNNTRSNLRSCTRTQNAANQRCRNPHGYKGVSRTESKCRPWRAGINPGGKSLYLGRYATKEEAARAYDQKARELWGDFARVNFPTLGERPETGGQA